MGYFAQFLYMGETPEEIINGARTSQRLRDADLCGPGLGDPIANGGCDALLYEPTCTAVVATPIKVATFSVNATSSGTTLALVTTADAEPGDKIIIFASSDNLSATTPTFVATDAIGNTYQTWTQGARNATPGNGIAGAVIVCTVVIPVPSGSTITVTTSGAVTARAAFGTIMRNLGSLYSIATNTNGSSTTPSITTASIPESHIVVAGMALESNSVPAVDSDTTRGSWASLGNATANTGVALTSAVATADYKVVTADGTQTWNVSVSSTDWVAYAVAFEPTYEVDEWQTVDLTASGAPWDNGSEAADEAIGFFIEEWTGLDGAHHGRSVSTYGRNRGGASYGPMTSGGRVMKLNVTLLGTTERGLTYLFRWLEQTLMSCCDPCGTSTLWVREFCPGDWYSELSEGLGLMHDVVLIEGPTWEAQPVDDSGCVLRRASFTLGAGDPCIYSPSTGTTSEVSTITGVTLAVNDYVAACNTWDGSDRKVTAQLATPDYGQVAAKVTISSPPQYRTDGTRKPLPDLRITGYADPDNTGLDACRQRRMGELILSGVLTSGLEIVVDFATRSVRSRDPYGDTAWIDASRLIAPTVAGIRRWWAADARAYAHVVVEPVYEGLSNSVEDLADPVSYWTVGIESVSRWSCC